MRWPLQRGAGGCLRGASGRVRQVEPQAGGLCARAPLGLCEYEYVCRRSTLLRWVQGARGGEGGGQPERQVWLGEDQAEEDTFR